MTLVLELPPTLEARLRSRAAQGGQTEEQVALTAVEEFLKSSVQTAPGKRSIKEFRGVGRHNPVGMDPQAYVNELRKEWGDRP